MHAPAVGPIRVEDSETLRPVLDADPVANAVLWDRIFQQEAYGEVFVDGFPPNAILALRRPRTGAGATGFALRASDGDAARSILEPVPAGPVFFFLEDEALVPALQGRAADLQARIAWLYAIRRDHFVDRQAHAVSPVSPDAAPMIAQLWEPDWPSESYVRRRIEGGPTCGIYAGGELVAWALTHFEADRVSMLGFFHVLEPYRRRGYGASVASALTKDVLKRGKTPVLHVYEDNARSMRLVERIGYRRVKRQVWGDGSFR